MSPEIKLSKSREEKFQEIKDFISSATLSEMRLIDIALQERKSEVVNNGIEKNQPAISLIACEIGGRDYIYSQEYKEGKKFTRKVKEKEIPNYNFESAKITPKAKEVLQVKYGIKI